MLRGPRYTCALALGLACATAAHAQDDIDPYALSPEQLFDASVVSVSRSSEGLRDAPAAITVITGEDIARAGVTTIPEALRLAPGVQVSQVTTSAWAVSIRGFSSALANKLLVLIDGREVYDPLFAGVYWDVQDTNLDDIDRIEIIRGPGATLWGANAVNGVINIITKQATDTQGLLATAVAGDHERAILTARYGAQAGQTRWRVFGRYFDRSSFDSLGGGDSNGDWTAWRGGFRVDSTLSARDELTVQGEAYTSDSGQLRVVPQLTAPYASLVREDISASGAHLLTRWTRSFDSGSQLVTQAYLDATQRDQFTLEDERLTFDLDTQYQFAPLGAHRIIAGARYRHTSADTEDSAIVYRSGGDSSAELFSVFVQDEIALSERFNLTLGSKIDHNDFTGVEVQPSARLSWSGDDEAAWAAISRAVRTPSELERDYTAITGVIPPGVFPVPISVQLTPSPNFESEELLALELGYRRTLAANLELDLAAFHNRYDGLSTLMLQAGQVAPGPPLHLILPIAFENQTDAASWGLEAALNWRAAPNLNFSAAYSFLDLELDGPPPAIAIDSEAAQTASPRNQANVRAQWDVNERLTLDGLLFYVDSVPATAVDPFTRFDLRLGFRLTDAVQLDVVGQNLLDDRHREFASAVEIERSAFVRLSWRR